MAQIASTKCRILIIEDESDIQDVLTEELSSYGYEVVSSSNGLDGMRLFLQDPQAISLVICDIGMPKMNGLDFIREVTAKVGYVPVVMLTAHSDSSYTTEAMSLGAIDYLQKPFDFDQMKKQINHWIDIGRRRRETLPKVG